MVTAAPAALADCSLDVAVDCQPGGSGTFRVQTAPGARVTLEGPAGTRTINEGGTSAWSGPVDDPYRAGYTFAVSNEAATAETVTTYTFLVPRECLNLAFVGLTEEQRPGPPATCTDRRALTPPVCPVPPVACTVTLDLTTARRGDVAGYQVTGTWASLDLEVLHDGTPLAEPKLTSERGTLDLPLRGTYTMVATVNNVVGDEASCRASVEVVGADWIVRPFAAFLATGDAKMKGSVTPGDCPCTADTTYGCDDGYGLGIGVERLLTERVGVEARAMFGRLDSQFSIGANGVGIEDDTTLDTWDLSLGVNFHLLPDGPVDWYAGPFVGYLSLADRTLLVVDRSLEYDAESDLTYGAQMGLDWPFGDSDWSLHFGARYTRASLDLTQRDTDPDGAVFEQSEPVDLDPITLELGVAYHF